jgi:hypothetical protein
MLCALSISIWSARKLDRAATSKTTTDAGAAADAARVNKNLLAGQDAALKKVQAIASAARADHYALTLPWSDNGPRILSVDLWQQLNKKLQNHALEFKAAVDEFIADYSQARDRARFSLGTLFDDADFPSASRVAQKFSFDFDFDPLPTAGDFRANLTDADADAIRKEIDARNNARIADAMRDVWQQLYAHINRISATLPQYEAGDIKRFNDTIVTNLRDMLTILPGLNITNDPTLAAIADRAAAELATIHPQTLRDDPTARSRATSAASSICATMAQHLGIATPTAAAPAPAPVPQAPSAPAQVFDLFAAPIRAA